FIALGAILSVIGAGCSSSSSGGTGTVPTTTSTGQGTCAATCDKPCGSDQDCNTSQGELCCDFGETGKICQNAKSCPKFCHDDSTCETAMGQACVRTTLGSQKLVCEPAAAGLKLCQGDSDCTATNTICCQIYSSNVC